MRPLPIPGDDAETVFLTSISNYEDAGLRARLITFAPQIGKASDDYIKAKGELLKCQVVKRNAALVGVTKDELIAVYNGKFAKAAQPGRPFYDRIKASPPRGQCPLCGKAPVTQLDHNFEKAVYPVLAVTPANLVPSCSDCNRKKENAQQDDSENTLHPYFHDIDGSRWLHAEVIQNKPPAIRYVVVPQTGWSASTISRANNHLNVFGLRKAYSVDAAQEMTEIRQRLVKLRSDSGPDGVRRHLVEEARSREAAAKNSWRTALYYGLAQSDWFCSEGVLLVA